MGFIVLGEIIRARRTADPKLIPLISSLSNGGMNEDPLPAVEDFWGISPDQSIWINNYLGQSDENLDVFLAMTPTAAVNDIDWRTAEPGTIQSVQRTAHGWLYAAIEGPFDPAGLDFEWYKLRLPDAEWIFAKPRYAQVPLRLMLPPPSDWALNQVQQVNEGGLGVAIKPVDFLKRFPCWPIDVEVMSHDGWRKRPGGGDTYNLPVLQPDTVRLRSALSAMHDLLVRRGIFCREIETRGSIGESWYSVVNLVTQEQLAILDKESTDDVPLAWYSIQYSIDLNVDDAIRDIFDPEHLVEEWWDRVDFSKGSEPPPGQHSVTIYFMGEGQVTTSDVGTAIVSAATELGLPIKWSGDPKRALTVGLFGG
jgi:hypothetical protein